MKQRNFAPAGTTDAAEIAIRGGDIGADGFCETILRRDLRITLAGVQISHPVASAEAMALQLARWIPASE